MLISRHFAAALKVWSKIGQFSATSSFLLWHTWSRSRSDFHLPLREPEIIRKSFFSSLVFADRAESRSTSLRELETDDLSWLFFFFVATTSLNEARSRQKVAKVARCLQSRRFWEKVVIIEILPLSSVGCFQAWIKWSVISRKVHQFKKNIKAWDRWIGEQRHLVLLCGKTSSQPLRTRLRKITFLPLHVKFLNGLILIHLCIARRLCILGNLIVSSFH